MREQADVLEHVADAPAQRDRIERAHILALEPHNALARIGKAVDEAEQRGLAGAGLPTMATNSPSAMVSDTLSSAGRPLSKRFETASKAMMGCCGMAGSAPTMPKIARAWQCMAAPPRRLQVRFTQLGSRRAVGDPPARGTLMAEGAAAQSRHAPVTAPAVGLSDVTITFRVGNGPGYTAVERASLTVADGEFVAIVGSDRLRQVDLAQCRRRAARAIVGARRHLRLPACRAEPAGRLSVSGRRAVSMEDRARQCRHRSADGGRGRR